MTLLATSCFSTVLLRSWGRLFSTDYWQDVCPHPLPVTRKHDRLKKQARPWILFIHYWPSNIRIERTLINQGQCKHNQVLQLRVEIRGPFTDDASFLTSTGLLFLCSTLSRRDDMETLHILLWTSAKSAGTMQYTLKSIKKLNSVCSILCLKIIIDHICYFLGVKMCTGFHRCPRSHSASLYVSAPDTPNDKHLFLTVK